MQLCLEKLTDMVQLVLGGWYGVDSDHDLPVGQAVLCRCWDIPQCEGMWVWLTGFANDLEKVSPRRGELMGQRNVWLFVVRRAVHHLHSKDGRAK